MPSLEPKRSNPSVPQWARALVHALDEAIAIPGTGLSIGWDAIAGFFLPGIGDAVSAASHVVLLILAFRARVPRIVLVRMTGNAVVDALTGMLPLLGDLFDIAFKANRRNLELLDRATLSEPRRRSTLGDYIAVWSAVAAVLLVMLLPIVLGAAALHWLFSQF